MSPRCTHALHERGDLKHLAPVLVIGLESGNLRSQLSAIPKAACTVQDRAANSFGSANSGRFK
jgi:hypothetical protein